MGKDKFTPKELTNNARNNGFAEKGISSTLTASSEKKNNSKSPSTSATGKILKVHKS